MNVHFAEAELRLMDSAAYSFDDALQHADHAGLFEEEDESCIHGIYERAGFHGDTHVDVAMSNSCQLHAGMVMLYGDDYWGF